MKEKTFVVIVIGAGPAGSAAAKGCEGNKKIKVDTPISWKEIWITG